MIKPIKRVFYRQICKLYNNIESKSWIPERRNVISLISHANCRSGNKTFDINESKANDRFCTANSDGLLDPNIPIQKD